jgi:transposase
MMEVREVLRLWLRGLGYRGVARVLGVDRKTVRRYVVAAQRAGLEAGAAERTLSDEFLGQVAEQLRTGRPARQHGESWGRLEGELEFLRQRSKERLTLAKTHDLLTRRGVAVPYRTLQRFCAAQDLEFGRGPKTTVRVADGEPGKELQVDFGRLGLVWDEEQGRRRWCKVMIFIACYSRHLFCWPCFGETLAVVIEGFEEAWRYFGGVFEVVIPDSMKAIVDKADDYDPRLNPVFLEYAQARGFLVDPCRIRRPKDKPRIERAVQYVRGSGFQGEDFRSLLDAREGLRRWALEVAGLRVHGTTQRRPLEHFGEAEQSLLRPAPEDIYEVPLYVEGAKVGRDFHIQVARALYSIPWPYVRRTVQVWANSRLVKVYYRGQLIKEHPRKAPGQRSTDERDYPEGKRAYAMRDVESLQQLAASHGQAVGAFVQKLLAGPLPWNKMRQAYRLLGLVRTYGASRVDLACRAVLDAGEVQVGVVKRILERAMEQSPPARLPEPGQIVQLRFARSGDEFRLGGGEDSDA